MPPPASSRPRFVLRLAAHAWWILLLAALALLVVATNFRIARVEALTNSPTWSVDPAARERTSPTGYEHGQRALIVPGLHTPSFWWIMEAQQAASDGRFRLRQIDYDSPPNGRATHRTALYRWWLTGVGWLRATGSGEPLGGSIERGALLADPLLLGLLLVAGAGYVARYFGGFAASGFVISGISLFPLASNFQPGAPDAHSLAWVLALGSLLPLLVPPQRVGGKRRSHFVVAGICGGLGLWNSATTQAPFLLAIALGALGAELLRRGQLPPAAETPRWRAWALAGAVTTLAASAFEFAPTHLSWSLEAVHPVHALAWWGAGEVLTAAPRWTTAGRKGLSRRSLVRLASAVAAMAAMAAWPVAAFLSKSGSLLAPDFYALELANHPSAGLAPRLGAWLGQSHPLGAKWATLLPLGLCFVLLARMRLARSDREERGRLLQVLVVAVFVGILACLQLRWWNLFDIVALAALTVLLAGSHATEAPPRWKLLGAGLLVLPGAIVGFPAAGHGNEVKDLTPLEAQALVARDFSYWLAKRSGPGRDVILSTPIFSSAVAFYGGFAVIASSDEENQTGLLAANRIAAVNTLEEASVLVQSRGITHVVLPLWDPMLPHLVRAGRNLQPTDPLPDDALLTGLLRWGSPVWMRPMNYVVPPDTGLQDFQLVSYAVQAPMEDDLFLSRLADLFVERGMPPEAEAVSLKLRDYPRSAAALGALAKIALVRSDQAQLMETLEKLLPALARVSARHLPADRRISLAGVLLQSHHREPARDQIVALMPQLDVATLRTLTPGAVKDLLILSRVLNVPFSDSKLKTEALALLPPAARAHLAP